MIGVPISELTPYGVLLAFVLMIGFGLLIPRWTHLQRVNDLKEQIQLLREIVKERDQQIRLMQRPGEVVVKAIEEIKEVAATK